MSGVACGTMVCVMPGPPPMARRRRWTASPRADVAPALVLAVVSLATFDAYGLRAPAWVVIPVIELAALPLAVRRSWPLAVLAITLAAAIAGELLLAGFQISRTARPFWVVLKSEVRAPAGPGQPAPSAPRKSRQRTRAVRAVTQLRPPACALATWRRSPWTPW